ncbi:MULTISPECIES: hypothetical protein [unclassified Paenarthrobacter]|uniref:hypothetical protein n=1 Tax=unclassified Paenarthrobacter TaxID=2634190 RepID=UPI0038248785
MERAKQSVERRYWLVLSLVYGVSLEIIGFAQGIWPVIFPLAAVVFIVVHAFANGQVLSGNQRFSTATPGVGLLAMVGGAVAVILRDTEIAFWAIPLLGVAGFAMMMWFLNRYGKYHHREKV